MHVAGDERWVGKAANIEVPVGQDPVAEVVGTDGAEESAAVEDRLMADVALEQQTVEVEGATPAEIG
ncbi:Uncharacterised protein [Mycobacterium tuberculosis]|nr:Uncharacterised protein [Mycobacterium tuberculosis]